MPKIKAFNVFLLLCIASFIFVVILFFSNQKFKKDTEISAKNRALGDTVLMAKKLDARISRTQERIESLAIQLCTGRIAREDLPGLLSRIVENNPIVSSIGIAYEPDASEPGKGPLFPCYTRVKGKGSFLDASSLGDYTDTDWYKQALERGPHWREPFVDEITEKLAVAFVAPLKGPGAEKPAGVLRATITLSNLGAFISTIDPGTAAYTFMLSKKGTLLFSPVWDQVEKGVTVPEVVGESGIKSTEAAAREAMKGKSVFWQTRDPDTGQAAWIFFEPIHANAWTIAAVFGREQLAPDESLYRRQHIHLALAFTTFLTLLSVLVFRAHQLNKYGLWAVSLTFSLLCLGSTCYILCLVLQAPLYSTANSGMITSKMLLHRFMNDCSGSELTKRGPSPVFIPTGIQLQTIEFTGPNDIAISGHVWQKYRKGAHDEISRGFILPEAKSVTIEEAYRDEQGDLETLGWHFEATIREDFDYQKYPFDRPDIWIWLKHKDFYKQVILVPDIDSYHFFSPAMCPGLSENVVLPGFSYLAAYFDYRTIGSNANFGILTRKPGVMNPELFYHIIARRQFITPFVSKIFPLVIMLAMLFIVQLTFTHEEERKKSFGLSGLAVAGTVITFFLSTILAQGNLRSELTARGITFMENFYFITYFVLLEVVVVAYLITGHSELKILRYEHCLIPKLLYMPFISLLILLCSMVSFY